jgi:CRISPR-associated endonuclease/helicase Cas3
MRSGDIGMGAGKSEYIIGGAGLAVGETTHPFDHKYDPRGFQAQALDWIHGDDSPPVSAVCAPTGGGKTDVITAVAAASNKLLCVYPTNALITSQQSELEAAGFDTTHITGDTLSGHGDDRADDLHKRVQNPHDIVITNPDILQSVIQGSYFSPGSRILDIFAQFDAAVYDEFHYYNPLAASGLMTQIKILSERGSYRTVDDDKGVVTRLPKFLLTSATPDETFTQYVSDDLQFDVNLIRSTVHTLDVADKQTTTPSDLIYNIGEESPTARAHISTVTQSGVSPDKRHIIREDPPAHISRFREPMYVTRTQEWIGDCFPIVAEQLATTIEAEYDGGGPVAAVIFNSAAQSNEFNEYLRHSHPELHAKVAKDNGYDTNAGRTIPDEVAGLNTTSKGEVGLNFDLKRLVMAAPHTTSQFIQRIGRAARKSPAIINLYGLADPSWPSVQSYPAFLSRIPDILPDRDHNHTQIRHLTGIRAAAGLHSRTQDDIWHNEGVFHDLTGYQTSGEWQAFFETVSEAVETHINTSESDAWGNRLTLDRATTSLLKTIDTLRGGIDTLRGQSLSHPVTYPRDGGVEDTEYSLISALSHYGTDPPTETETTRIHLTTAPPLPIRGVYVGEPCGGDGIDLTQSNKNITQELRTRYLSLVDAADTLSQLDIDAGMVELFFKTTPLAQAMIPERIVAGDEFEILCDVAYGEVDEIRSGG